MLGKRQERTLSSALLGGSGRAIYRGRGLAVLEVEKSRAIAWEREAYDRRTC